MADKDKKSKHTSLQAFLGKAAGEKLTEKDIQKGLSSTDANVVRMAKNAARTLNKKVAKEDYGDLNGMRIQVAQVGMEAFAGANIAKLMTDTLPSLVTDVKMFFGRFNPNELGITLKINEREFIKEINKHSYLDISPLAAFVPEGLDVPYLQYTIVLEGAAMHISNILTGVMNSYSVFLGQLISNPDAALSTVSFNKDHESLEKSRLQLNMELGACFKNGSTKTEVSIKDVVDRNSDWAEVIKSANTIMELVNSVNRNVLNKKINECSEYLDIILEKIKRDELKNLSPEGIKNLSLGAYNIASELEFYSAIYYKALAYITSIEQTTEHFEKVFKR